MTMIMICAYIGIVIWVIGILMIIAIIKSKDEDFGSMGDRIFGCSILLVACGLIGMLFTNEATSTAVKDIKVSYVMPTSIIKTNDITNVLYIRDSKVLCNISSSEASFWNSSNIMVKVINGNNMYGNEVNSSYSVVVRGE